MWNYSNLNDSCDGEYVQARAVRDSELDYLLDDTKKEAYVITNNRTLREAGFMCEGDSYCITCGLREMNGEFPVCDDCGQCDNCGCDCS